MINKILEIHVGSHLYGTSTPTSDTDFSGIFISPIEYYFGLKDIDEMDLSIISKLENGKNSPDAIDRKLFELRNFINLAMKGNPNIIEHLFVNRDNITHINYYGEEILKNSHLFPSKAIYHKFLAYANSQKHKMVIKEQNYNELKKAFDFFNEQMSLNNSTKFLVEYRDEISKQKIGTEKEHHFIIGDLNFIKNVTIKKVQSILETRMSKISNRYELVTKYGYDTKFASHLIRLLIEGRELLDTGGITFPLKSANLILSIKKGEYEINEIIKMSEYFESELTKSFETSKLPETSYFDDINNLTIKLGKMNFIFGENL